MRKYAYKIRLTIAGIVLILAIMAIWGMYPFKILDLQFTALMQRALTTAAYSIVVLFFIVVLSTIAFGRFYCSILCPVGIMQDFFMLLTRKNKCHGRK